MLIIKSFMSSNDRTYRFKMLRQISNPQRLQTRNIEIPLEPTTTLPKFKALPNIITHHRSRPLIHRSQMSGGNITTSPDIRKSNVLALMTCWAKRNQPYQPLNVANIIVIPDLMTFNGVLVSLAFSSAVPEVIADFAAVVGCFERSLFQ
jgi:hypothetical protein